MNGKISTERGAAILELAIVLPVLVLLFFASLELVRALEAKNAIAIFSRELAHAVYTDCLELDSKTISGADAPYIQECAQTDASQLYAIATGGSNPVMPGISMVVNVFEYRGGAVVNRAHVEFPPGTPSRYNTASGIGPGASPVLYSDLTRVVIAETNFAFSPIIYSPFSLNLYEVTIY